MSKKITNFEDVKTESKKIDEQNNVIKKIKKKNDEIKDSNEIVKKIENKKFISSLSKLNDLRDYIDKLKLFIIDLNDKKNSKIDFDKIFYNSLSNLENKIKSSLKDDKVTIKYLINNIENYEEDKNIYHLINKYKILKKLEEENNYPLFKYFDDNYENIIKNNEYINNIREKQIKEIENLIQNENLFNIDSKEKFESVINKIRNDIDENLKFMTEMDSDKIDYDNRVYMDELKKYNWINIQPIYFNTDYFINEKTNNELLHDYNNYINSVKLPKEYKAADEMIRYYFGDTENNNLSLLKRIENINNIATNDENVYKNFDEINEILNLFSFYKTNNKYINDPGFIYNADIFENKMNLLNAAFEEMNNNLNHYSNFEDFKNIFSDKMLKNINEMYDNLEKDNNLKIKDDYDNSIREKVSDFNNFLTNNYPYLLNEKFNFEPLNIYGNNFLKKLANIDIEKYQKLNLSEKLSALENHETGYIKKIKEYISKNFVSNNIKDYLENEFYLNENIKNDENSYNLLDILKYFNPVLFNDLIDKRLNFLNDKNDENFNELNNKINNLIKTYEDNKLLFIKLDNSRKRKINEISTKIFFDLNKNIDDMEADLKKLEDAKELTESEKEYLDNLLKFTRLKKTMIDEIKDLTKDNNYLENSEVYDKFEKIITDVNNIDLDKLKEASEIKKILIRTDYDSNILDKMFELNPDSAYEYLDYKINDDYIKDYDNIYLSKLFELDQNKYTEKLDEMKYELELANNNFDLFNSFKKLKNLNYESYDKLKNSLIQNKGIEEGENKTINIISELINNYSNNINKVTNEEMLTQYEYIKNNLENINKDQTKINEDIKSYIDNLIVKINNTDNDETNIKKLQKIINKLDKQDVNNSILTAINNISLKYNDDINNKIIEYNDINNNNIKIIENIVKNNNEQYFNKINTLNESTVEIEKLFNNLENMKVKQDEMAFILSNFLAKYEDENNSINNYNLDEKLSTSGIYDNLKNLTLDLNNKLINGLNDVLENNNNTLINISDNYKNNLSAVANNLSQLSDSFLTNINKDKEKDKVFLNEIKTIVNNKNDNNIENIRSIQTQIQNNFNNITKSFNSLKDNLVIGNTNIEDTIYKSLKNHNKKEIEKLVNTTELYHQTLDNQMKKLDEIEKFIVYRNDDDVVKNDIYQNLNFIKNNLSKIKTDINDINSIKIKDNEEFLNLYKNINSSLNEIKQHKNNTNDDYKKQTTQILNDMKLNSEAMINDYKEGLLKQVQEKIEKTTTEKLNEYNKNRRIENAFSDKDKLKKVFNYQINQKQSLSNEEDYFNKVYKQNEIKQALGLEPNDPDVTYNQVKEYLPQQFFVDAAGTPEALKQNKPVLWLDTKNYEEINKTPNMSPQMKQKLLKLYFYYKDPKQRTMKKNELPREFLSDMNLLVNIPSENLIQKYTKYLRTGFL